MTPIIDDFDSIRAARDNLARERDERLFRELWGIDAVDEFGASPAPVPGHLDAFFAGHADAEMLHAFGPKLVRHPNGSWSLREPYRR